MNIVEIKNTIQNYDWGDVNSIPSILGIQNEENKPMAELWMGAHPKAPSKIVSKEGLLPLNEAIAKDGLFYLGVKDFERYGQLPFLFKILAAGSPLSIQAHPSLSQAKVGFARENEEGIALDAFNRSYKDANHKPEMICAITEFYAMNGFREIPEIINNFRQVEDDCVKPLLEILSQKSGENILKTFFNFLMNMDKSSQKILSDAISKALSEKSKKTECDEWSLKLSNIYPGDIGTLCPFFLNIICLQPGQAMFLNAGRLHSYLQGTGIELMANSDNVLRGGLTPKFVDTSELLSVLNFESSNIEIISIDENKSIFTFPSFVDEFLLKQIKLNDSDCKVDSLDRAGILICLEGSGVIIENGSDSLAFAKGQTFFIPAKTGEYTIQGSCKLYLSTTS